MKTRYLLWSGWYMLILDIMLNADHVHPVETICHLPNCMVPATLPVTTPLATPWCLDEALDVLPRPLSISLQAPKGTLQSGQVPGDKRVDLVDLVELWCRWVTYIYTLAGGFEQFLFSIIYGIILPIDFHNFQRGCNHQPEMILNLEPADWLARLLGHMGHMNPAQWCG